MLTIPLWIILNHILHKSSLLYNEGLLESLTTIFLLSASVLIIIGIRKRESEKWSRLYLFVIGIALFVLGMEEISWGQTIFDWPTPWIFADLNFQNETNIHNMFVFNKIFGLVYAFACLVIGYILLNLENIKSGANFSRPINEAIALLPSYEFSYWGYIFLFLGMLNLLPFEFGEITEEIFSILCMLYALEIYSHSANST